MSKLPKKVKLTPHARLRLEQRKDPNVKYNTTNLMRSSCKWFTTKDFIEKSKLYQHSLYVCRKSTQMGYITDGNIEVLYNKGTGVAITIMEVKEKFLPITQYIKPGILGEINKKKEIRKMKKQIIGVCSDCGKEAELNTLGLCKGCRIRKMNMKRKGVEYVRYLDLSEAEKLKVDNARKKAIEIKEKKNENNIKEIVAPDLSVPENYYQIKAENQPMNNEVKWHVVEEPKKTTDTLENSEIFIKSLRECGCEISNENLQSVLDVLLATNKLKDIIMTIVKDDNQQTMLDLDQALNACERKLQHNWEYNGFQEEDDIKFKTFLTWRRVLKSAIFFWKKLYQTNTLIELEKAWKSYQADPTEKPLLAGDKITSSLKRYQITTESISTILNTRRPFTRVFYAKDKDEAYDMFLKWMNDRQLHENKAKTSIIELTSNEN